MRLPLVLVVVFLTTLMAVAGVVGVFQGRIVRPTGAKAEDGILYVRARNGMARKVRVEKAVIEFDEDVPKGQRRREAAKSLCDETLVRVTAEQSENEDGEWKAINILILAEPDEPRAGARVQSASFLQSPGKKVAPQSRPKKVEPKGNEPGKTQPEKPGSSGFCVP